MPRRTRNSDGDLMNIGRLSADIPEVSEIDLNLLLFAGRNPCG